MRLKIAVSVVRSHPWAPRRSIRAGNYSKINHELMTTSQRFASVRQTIRRNFSSRLAGSLLTDFPWSDPAQWLVRQSEARTVENCRPIAGCLGRSSPRSQSPHRSPPPHMVRRSRGRGGEDTVEIGILMQDIAGRADGSDAIPFAGWRATVHGALGRSPKPPYLRPHTGVWSSWLAISSGKYIAMEFCVPPIPLDSNTILPTRGC